MKLKGISKERRYLIVLFVILFLQLFRLIYVFSTQKEDLHVDEAWSFGLSNSYYEPFIFQTADHSRYTNLDEWIPGKVMKDYLTVNEGQRFAYKSVYYNQAHDYHPPLYYYIFHTICSFFPETFSYWYGFVINIVSNIVTIIFLYKLMYAVTKSPIVSLLGCAVYGFSSGALNTFIFLRMYALLTMFSVISLYLHANLYYTGNIKKYILPLFGVTLLGCLTHHFYIPYAGLISVCFCIYYLIKRKYKVLCIYAVVMLGAVGVSLMLFPETIDHLFSGRIDDEPKYTFNWQFMIILNTVLCSLFGFTVPVSLDISYGAVGIVICCVSVIISPLIFLFRREKWFMNFGMTIKRFIAVLFIRIKKADLMIISMLASVVGIILLTALTVSVIAMSVFIDRYIFMIYPAACVLLVVLIYNFAGLIIKNKKWLMIVTNFISVLLCIISNIRYPCNYLFQKPEGVIDCKQYIDNSDCVFISVDNGALTIFSEYSMDSHYIYPMQEYDLQNQLDTIPDPPDNAKAFYYCIADSVFYKEPDTKILTGKMPELSIGADQSRKITKEKFEELLDDKYAKVENLGNDLIFGNAYSLYRVSK